MLLLPLEEQKHDDASKQKKPRSIPETERGMNCARR